MKRWQQLLTIIVLASLAFGGSFTCTASTNDDYDDRPPPPPTNPAPAPVR